MGPSAGLRLSFDHAIPPAQTDKAILRGAKSGYVLAVLVLLASLFVVAWYWRSARQREMAAAQADFVASTDETTSLLHQRLGYYELVTRGGVALFGTVARPTRQQWQDYVDGLNIGERFPALVGLGFAAYLSPGQLSDMQNAMRSGGEGLFELRPHGVREHYGAILYLEPRSQANLDAIGFDMYSEPIRQAAMEAALDSGEARLSGIVHLVQDAGGTNQALLMFLPVFRSGSHPGQHFLTPGSRCRDGYTFRSVSPHSSIARCSPRRGIRTFASST